VSEFADVVYGCSAYHDPTTEGGFRYDDPEVGIEWPADLALTPSARDRSAPSLSDIAATLPFAYA
jgi:dTDP-4-dehydrorhamnose 3,5-epimerase